MPKKGLPTPDAQEQSALSDAVRAVLAPVARLALARGVPFATLEELLRQAVVQAADAAHPDLLPHRKVSRISTSTGINRREVTRLIQVLREGRAGETPAAARWPPRCSRTGSRRRAIATGVAHRACCRARAGHRASNRSRTA